MRGMKMKLGIMASALLATGLATSAMADDVYYDSARVLSVTPQTERVRYVTQDCHTDYVEQRYQERSPAGAILGGIAGGLLGAQIGKGNGRVAGAAVGAGVGALVGDRVDNSNSRVYSESRPVQRCVDVENWRTETSGYHVEYRYNGRNYTTFTQQPPGDRIQVRVAVSDDHDHRGGRQVRYYEPGYEQRPGYGDGRPPHPNNNRRYW